MLLIPQYARPSAGTGIADAATIGEECHFLQFPSPPFFPDHGMAGVMLELPSFEAP